MTEPLRDQYIRPFPPWWKDSAGRQMGDRIPESQILRMNGPQRSPGITSSILKMRKLKVRHAEGSAQGYKTCEERTGTQIQDLPHSPPRKWPWELQGPIGGPHVQPQEATHNAPLLKKQCHGCPFSLKIISISHVGPETAFPAKSSHS